jgi:hypothetical protein
VVPGHDPHRFAAALQVLHDHHHLSSCLGLS